VRLNEIYENWKDKVDFYCVYIREAHPEDGWQVPQNLEDDIVFGQPKSLAERAEVAKACVLKLELEMPTLLDDMDDSTDVAYAALPERLYVIDSAGIVTFQCGPGPFGFDVDGWVEAIENVTAARS
jgi:hypothetical protein